jgi:hypothetical protein
MAIKKITIRLKHDKELNTIKKILENILYLGSVGLFFSLLLHGESWFDAFF